MISPKSFIAHLGSEGVRFFTGVPCSYFQSVIRLLKNEPQARYYVAPNEGAALALASGAYLSGQGACVMIQNSGLGNLMNPLSSLNLIYKIPILLFVSGRAYGIPDEPQHEIMGKSMPRLLEALHVPFFDLSQEENGFKKQIVEGLALMRSKHSPVVFFVRKGTFDDSEIKSPAVPEAAYPMKRIDAISVIRECLSEEDLVFATTGKPSRELFAVGDRPGNFYMQGSMGHIGSLALGTALCRPERRVVVLDGDGACLMHLGALSAIGHYRPGNFYHFILDNESYETTGDQDTTSATTDFEAVAKACGYRAAYGVSKADDLRRLLSEILKQDGPALVRIKINRLPTPGIPRITTRYEAPEITKEFMENLSKTGRSPRAVKYNVSI